MSFILDALKKSENERQRQIGPSLADVQVRRPRNDKPWWAVAVAALLVVNLGVLLIVLTRKDDAQPGMSAPTTPAVPQAQSSAAPAATRAAPVAEPATASADQAVVPSGNPAVRSLAEEAGAMTSEDFAAVDNANLAAAAAVPEGPPLVRPIDAPSVMPLAQRPTQESRAAGNNEVLPTLGDLTASGTVLPELHLDIHVHSGNAAERFVFVNMRKYVEGETLNEGSVVERITTEGVVLNHRGLRFLLPRQ